MKLESLDTPAQVGRRAADVIARALAARPDARLVLPAGATPRPLYAELRRRAAVGEVDLAAAEVFQLDEVVGAGAGEPGSFQSLLRSELEAALGPHSPRLHVLDGGAADPAAEIERHARELEALGGADLVVLGLGRNAHVGFNEPGSTLASPARVVELDDVTREVLGPAAERGMTLGLAEIAAARRVVLLVTGGAKAQVLRTVLEEEPGPARPASLLHSHADATVLCDAAARVLLRASAS